MSYANIQLYCAALPTYNNPKGEKDKQQVINGDDPAMADAIDKIIC